MMSKTISKGSGLVPIVDKGAAMGRHYFETPRPLRATREG